MPSVLSVPGVSTRTATSGCSAMLRGRAPLDRDRLRRSAVGQRQGVHRAGGLDAGQRPHAIEHALEERLARLRRRVLCVGQRDVGAQDVPRARSPDPRARRRAEAAHEEARADQQDERERDLGDHEGVARDRAARVGVRAAALLERVVRVGAGQPPGRDGAREQSRDERDGEREGEHRRRRRGSRPRAASGFARNATISLTPAPATRSPSRPPASASRVVSAKSCRTMRARLAPRAARTAISLRRPSVRASTRLATFAQAISRTHPTAPSSTSSAGRTSPTRSSCSGMTAAPQPLSSAGYWRREPRGDRVHLRAGARDADAGLQAREHAEVVHAAHRAQLRGEDERDPQLRARRDRPGLRDDADDRVALLR